MQDFGKIIIIFGVVLVIVGLVLSAGDKIPFLGKLPGDLLIKRDNFTFYFPLTSGLVISVILTIIISLISKLKD